MKQTLTDLGAALKLTLQESADGQLVARGEFGRADVATQNRRVYPRKVWQREIQRVQEAVQSGKILGELDHPSDGKTSLKRVSHIITKLEMNDDGVIVGEAKILDNEHGRQLASILKAGGAVGVSSRGMGSTQSRSDGMEEVQEDFQYMTHDFVADPAVITSYPKFQTEVRMIEKERVVQETMEKTEAPVVVEDKKEKVLEPAVVKPAEASVEAPKEEPKVESPVVADAKVDAVKTEAKESPEKDSEEKPEDDKDSEEKSESEEDLVLGLKDKVASLEDQLKQANAAAEKAAAIADKLAVKLVAERAMQGLGESQKRQLQFFLGDIGRFENVTQFEKALAESKAMCLEVSKREKLIEARAKQALRMESDRREKAEKALAEATEQLAKLKKGLTEQTDLNKKLTLQVYMEQRLGRMENAGAIRKLCEGVDSKEEIDQVVARHTVKPVVSEDFQQIRRRLERAKTANLVESHLKETGTPKMKKVVEEGVDGEIADLVSNVGEIRSL